MNRGDYATARVEFERARDLQSRLVDSFPDVDSYNATLASTLNNLGTLLKQFGELDAARQQYESARSLLDKLAARSPDVIKYQIDLGACCGNLATLVRDEGKPSESLLWFDQAIETLRRVRQRDQQAVVARQLLCYIHWNRAMAYDQLGRYVKGASDWEKAIELSSPNEIPIHRANRAMSWLLAGRTAEAVAEADELTRNSKWNVGHLYNFACIYSVASGEITDKNQEYGDRAMELLLRAVNAGWKDAAHMKQDADLDSLRERDDFRELMEELGA